MNTVKLSVIIPVLPTATPGALSKTLESVLSQSLGSLEVICVTAGAALSVREDDRVHVISCPGCSTPSMAGEGLKCAAGTFIHFLIPGDTVPEYAYACAVRKAERYELDCLKCAGVAYDDHLGAPISLSRYTLSHLRPGDFHRPLRLKEPGTPLLTITHAPWTGLYRRSALEAGRVSYPDTQECAGTLFYYRLISGERRVMLSRDTLVVHHLPPFRGGAGAFLREMEERCRGLYLLEEGLVADGADDEDALLLFRDAMGRMEQRCRRWHRLLWEDAEEMEAMQEALSRCMDLYQGRFYDLCRDRLESLSEMLRSAPVRREPAERAVFTRKSIRHPRVSVVVRVGDDEDTLNETLHSLSVQTMEELELLCVGDGATQGALDILRQYAARDRRIRVLENGKNALNQGMDAARGEYVAFVDRGDSVQPDLYRRLYALGVKRKAEVVQADSGSFTVLPDGSARTERVRVCQNEAFYGRLVNPGREAAAAGLRPRIGSGIYQLAFLNRWQIRSNPAAGSACRDRGLWFQIFARAERAWFVKKTGCLRPACASAATGAEAEQLRGEYQFIWDWMDAAPEVRERFAPVYYVKLLEDSLDTLRRLDEALWPDYLKWMCERFQPLVEQRRLRREMVEYTDWTELNEILCDPEDYAARVRVSVILPVYNAGDTLRATLDALLAQRGLIMEVICVDDGSTDNSLSILREYERRVPRFTVLTQSSAGDGAARNIALTQAAGEYLFFPDAGDSFEPGMLRTVWQRAHSRRADLVVFPAEGCAQPCPGGDGAINTALLPAAQPFSGLDIRRDVFRAFSGRTGDKLFRAGFIRQTGVLFQEQRACSDLLFVLSHVVKARRIVTWNSVLAHHCPDGAAATDTREESWSCFFTALLALRDRLKAWGQWQRYERDFINYAQHLTLQNLTTLRGTSYYALYERLNGAWLEELDLLRHPRFYYYHDEEYQKLHSVTSLSAEDFLYQELDEARSRSRALSAQVQTLGADNRKLRNQVKNLTENKKELTDARTQLRQDNKKLKKKLKKMRESNSWRLGRILTWLPRRLKRLFRGE